MDYATGQLFKSVHTELVRQAATERLANEAAGRTHRHGLARFHWQHRPRPRRPARST